MSHVITTAKQLVEILDMVAVGTNGVLDWQWQIEWDPIDDIALSDKGRQGWLIYATFERVDVDTGQVGRGRSRDFVLWSGVTATGVVKTAYMAVRSVVEHELMHAFLYRGRPLFDPHADVDALWAISAQRTEGDDYRLWRRDDADAQREA